MRAGAAGRREGLSTRTGVLIIFFAGILLRAFAFVGHYLEVPADYVSPPTGSDAGIYHQALTQHFLEYLWYAHTALPIYHIRNWFIHNFVPPDDYRAAYVVLVSLSSSATAALIYRALKNFGVFTWLSATGAILLSVRLLGWDSLYHNGQWDLMNPFFIALLVWALSCFYRLSNQRHALVIGLAGMLLAASFQTAAAVVFPIIFLAVYVVAPRHHRVGLMLLALMPPILVFGALVLKNGYQFGVYSPTTGAGENIITNLNLALQSPTDTGALELGERLKYPAWWAWCYREAERLALYRQKNISGFQGTCNQSAAGYQFERVKAYFRDHGNDRMLRLVMQDERTAREKPWKFSGPAEARVSRMSVAYGKISSRLLFDVATGYPRNYLGRTYLNLKLFVLEGPRFEIDYPLLRSRLPAFANLLSDLLVPVLTFGIVLVLGLAVLIPVWFLAGRLFRAQVATPSAGWGIVWAVCVGFGFGTFASVGLHCCENYRHAFNYMPIVFFVVTFVLFRAVAAVGRLHRG